MTLLKFKNILLIFLIASFAITACSKSSAPKPTLPTNTKSDSVQSAIWSSDADIYFAGTFTGESPNNQTIASVWKNGVRTALGNGIADGIAVNGSDVYISGYVGNQAAFWKNGVFTNLGHSSSQSNANAIAISGNDVYIAGWIDDKAVVWKNGVPSAVFNPDSLFSATVANAITVSGTDVYMAGFSFDYIHGYFTPTYWKNGVATKLLQNSQSSGYMANAIAVSGNDVYVAGNTSDGATLWKNGIATALTTNPAIPSSANAIIIKGNDVYVAGYIYEIPSYWKNGKVTTLNSTQSINSNNIGFAIDGNDIYVAGGFNNATENFIYWRNNIAYSFSKDVSLIYGIAVMPH